MLTRPRAAVAALFLLVAACGDDGLSPRSVVPSVRVDSVTAVPGNVLARWVHVTVEGADAALAWFVDTSAVFALASVTAAPAPGPNTSPEPIDPFRMGFSPMQRLERGRGRILLLGLAQGRTYRVGASVQPRHGMVATSREVTVTTDSLPQPLRRFRASITGTPPQGYTLTSMNVDSAAYLLAFDGEGTIRWYVDAQGLVPGGRLSDFRPLRGGGYVAYVGLTSGWQPVAGRYFQFGPDGSVRRTFGAPLPFYTDSHELVPLYAGDSIAGTVLFGYDIRWMDMTRFGGPANARIAGHYIFRQSASGVPEWSWNSWDHLSMDGWIEEPQTFKSMENIDWAHPNALEIDRDGHYLVSWRHLAEVTKIDSRGAAILWRFGGAFNQFTIVDDPLGGFHGQHSIRVTPAGTYLLYDNGLRRSPPESRAVEYAIDPVTRTARMVWQYRASPALYTPFTGSVQRLENGNTLVGFMWIGRIHEVSPTSQLVWSATLGAPTPISTYRALRVRSLYRADD
jgi:hypothetical protein